MKNIPVYSPSDIETRWQKHWADTHAFEAQASHDKPKFYGLVEFPYPSGAGMHVGHIKAYSGLEVVARKRRMEGFNVLFPMGFDSFGLPAENYAIKTNTHPHDITTKNIEHFKDQMKQIGFSFDWSREIATSLPDYYKWTQWIFLKLFDHGLVFRAKTLVNYCPHCKVVLSNEDSQGGKCDICHSDVVQLPKDVWYLRITQYADKLLEGLETVDYPDSIKQQQVTWIGRSTGAFVDFSIDGVDEKLEIYTTRPDTLFGVTFMVMAPEHPLLDKYKDRIANWSEVEAYREECAKKTEFERTQLVKDKTGVKLDGLMAINPVNGKKIPIFIADYVMMGYGTGAIMAVPAHDQRDWEFAKKFGVDIIEVIQGGDISVEAYTGNGPMVNSGFLNQYDNKADSIAAMLEFLSEKGIGRKGIQYKMKDWAFNRQRYWGEPIPLIHCPKCGTVGVPYDQLPLRLPDVENFEPGTDGQSPLARIESFVNCTCPKCGGPAKRETDTMPQWAGSSWYFLRFVDPHNDQAFASMDEMKYWMPVDWYNGGMEHVTRHLLYSRFWHLGSDGEKMSKSKGNVVDPLDIVSQYGADTLRLYVLFMGDYTAAAPWNDDSVKGCKRFLDRVWRLMEMLSDDEGISKDMAYDLNTCIKKVGEDYEKMKYNTAIAAMMTLVNAIYAKGSVTRGELLALVKLLNPVAPHITEEINQLCKLSDAELMYSDWPKYDEAALVKDTVEVALQINGKLRGRMDVPSDLTRETAQAYFMQTEEIQKLVGDKTVRKFVFVPGRLVNIVVG